MSAGRAVAAEPWAGTGTLLRAGLRRDRRRLAVWVLAIGLVTVYAAVALGTVYPTTADRLARAAVVDTPAGVLLSGPGYGAAEGYPLGAMIANELTLSVVVAVAVLSIQVVVRHTRAEEEDGTAELLRAGAVGRWAPLTTALLLAALADAAAAAVVTAGLTGSGLAVVDSLALGVGIGLTGLVFGAVAAGTAQLTQHARAATGLALAVLAAAAVVRGLGDLLREGGSPLSWLSPIAWAQQTRAFVDLRWTPLLLSVALLGVLTAGAARLASGRDLGAGLVPPRPGPSAAAALLSGSAGLALQLQRATLLAWAGGLFLLGAVFGSLADAVAGMVGENEQLARVFAGSGGSLTDSFLAATALYLALCVAGAAVASVLRLRGEESSGRAELLLSTGLDRRWWLGGGLVVTAAGSALLLAAAGLGAGLAAAVVRGDPGLVPRQLEAQLVHLPGVLVVAGLAAALVGLLPRLAPLAWAVVGWLVVAGLFGQLLDLPGWLRRLSPVDWVPAVPAETFTAAAPAGLTLVAAALVCAALAGVRRRDVPA